MNKIMWEWSVGIDRQAAKDPNFFDSASGRIATYLVQRENERLKKILHLRMKQTIDELEDEVTQQP